MTKKTTQDIIAFNEAEALQHLRHYLPAQSPLKDFIHHNTLHAFQDRKFHDALNEANSIFGYKTYLRLDEYRNLYQKGTITKVQLEKSILKNKRNSTKESWEYKLLESNIDTTVSPRIGALRNLWKDQYHMNMDKAVHPILFRLLSSYLDQGISIRPFPVEQKGLIGSLREMVKTSYANLFRNERAKNLLLHTHCKTEHLLKIVIGDENLYEQYIFDQQFAHPGWSGMASTIENDPKTLLDPKKITLHDLIALEMLLEIDALDSKFGVENWKPMGESISEKPQPLFSDVPRSELHDIYTIWQDAYEWSYYDSILCGILAATSTVSETRNSTFDVFFCIDDRECSIRRHLEKADPYCNTFSTPGFFNVEFYFQPSGGKFFTKVCPAPLTPKYLIKEENAIDKRDKDAHFTKWSHSLLFGWMISQTLGFWSAFKLFINIFRPTVGPATSYSFRHMDKNADLTIENHNLNEKSQGLQIGFTIDEMTDRVEGLFKSTGFTTKFSSLVYFVGHGASSINNTHYAGYDCGACSGRPGSVNARVISFMANHPVVRKNLQSRGINLPETTQFLGALHDTTRDEIEFYDEAKLTPENKELHARNVVSFQEALHENAKERSRRFVLMNHNQSAELVHNKVKLRSVSLFEPRPELNHATNALCIVGRRALTHQLFLDRRAFMNSYDFNIDPTGKYLLNILKAAAPVCGGINLEYYFSRTDNYKLGAGTKLPHNVMGLIGVANGADGDLRPGLPLQMIEVHDPIRLMVMVEHFPEIILKTILESAPTYEWFKNEWIHLIAIHPENKSLFLFKNGEFIPYTPVKNKIKTVENMDTYFMQHAENLPVVLMKEPYEY